MTGRVQGRAAGRWRIPGITTAVIGWLLLIVVTSSPNAVVVGSEPVCTVEESRCVAAAGGEPAVTYLPAAQVDAAFTRGEPLVEVDDYKIHASRREGPGLAEIHTRDTDIMRVLQGSALLVTGGRIVDAKSTAAEELRGPSIAGGSQQRIGAGDVVIIPNGVPHWFREVEAPLLYYVVKVREEAGRDGGDV